MPCAHIDRNGACMLNCKPGDSMCPIHKADIEHTIDRLVNSSSSSSGESSGFRGGKPSSSASGNGLGYGAIAPVSHSSSSASSGRGFGYGAIAPVSRSESSASSGRGFGYGAIAPISNSLSSASSGDRNFMDPLASTPSAQYGTPESRMKRAHVRAASSPGPRNDRLFRMALNKLADTFIAKNTPSASDLREFIEKSLREVIRDARRDTRRSKSEGSLGHDEKLAMFQKYIRPIEQLAVNINKRAPGPRIEDIPEMSNRDAWTLLSEWFNYAVDSAANVQVTDMATHAVSLALTAIVARSRVEGLIAGM